MEEIQNNYSLLFLGCAAASCILVKSICKRLAITSIPFLILLGLLFQGVVPFENNYDEIIGLFGEIGLIMILFQVGIESNLKELLRQIKDAVAISVFEITISFIVVFFTLFYLLGINFDTALIFGVAFTATSIAVTVTLWEEIGALKTKSGQLLLDLSAMDDIAGVTLMAITFGFLANLQGQQIEFNNPYIYLPIFTVSAKLLILIVACYGFSIYVEPKLTSFLQKYELTPDPIITIICLALIFADLIGFIGLSIALGAFLLGLSFSRDSKTVRMFHSYQTLELFFIPFFFFSIGYFVTGLADISWFLILVIFAAVAFGKLIGVLIPSMLIGIPYRNAFLVSLSMVPRAEITLFILHYSKSYLNISPPLYTSAVIVSLISCLIPLFIKPLFLKTKTS